eukprot:jgi/Botrbrau1/9474/Bobra.0252s0093.1
MERMDEIKHKSSIAGHLLRIRDSKGEPLSPDLIKAQIAVLFWAGHDTTGNTIAWTLFAISRNPEIEARITAELDAAGLLASPIEPDPRELQLEDLYKLPYLDAVIKESMRYYLVVPTGTVRINDDEDVVLSNGFVIPRRTSVTSFLGGIHMNPLAYPDPNKFDPERWLEPNAKFIKVEYAKWQSYPGAEGRFPIASSGSTVSARDIDPSELRQRGFVPRFIPFSHGRRDCVGQTLAKLSIVSTLARLLGHFHFRLAEDRVGPASQVERDQINSVTLTPGNGMWMHAEPRCV